MTVYSTRVKTRWPNSLRAKILAYFEANPDEELTRADIAEKFCKSQKTMDGTLARLREDGEIEAAHVYRLPQRKRP